MTLRDALITAFEPEVDMLDMLAVGAENRRRVKAERLAAVALKAIGQHAAAEPTIVPPNPQNLRVTVERGAGGQLMLDAEWDARPNDGWCAPWYEVALFGEPKLIRAGVGDPIVSWTGKSQVLGRTCLTSYHGVALPYAVSRPKYIRLSQVVGCGSFAPDSFASIADIWREG